MFDMTAETVFKTIVREWGQRYGWRNRIHTDQTAQFESALFRSMCNSFHIKKSRTTPYKPQANEKVESLS